MPLQTLNCMSFYKLARSDKSEIDNRSKDICHLTIKDNEKTNKKQQRPKTPEGKFRKNHRKKIPTTANDFIKKIEAKNGKKIQRNKNLGIK